MKLRARRIKDETPTEVVRAARRLSPVARTVLLTRVVRVLVWSLLLASPVFAVAAWAGGRGQTATTTAVGVEVSATGPARFAEMYLAAWLRAGSGSEGSLTPFYPGAVDLTEVAANSRFATATAALSTRMVQPGHWEVLVAADVAVNRKGQLAGDGLRYYSVPVLALGGPEAGGAGAAGAPASWVAERLPAQVAPPAALAAPALAYDDSLVSDGPLRDSVAGFLTTYLTGGSFGRYLIPDVSLPAFPSAPYASVNVTAVTVASPVEGGEVETQASPPDGQRAGALATVHSVDRDGLHQQMQYPLALIARAGRWEVASLSTTWLDSPPALAAPTPSAAPDGVGEPRSTAKPSSSEGPGSEPVSDGRWDPAGAGEWDLGTTSSTTPPADPAAGNSAGADNP